MLHPVPRFDCHNCSTRLSLCIHRHTLWCCLSISPVIEPGSQALLPSLEWSRPTVCPGSAQCNASLLNQSQCEPPLAASMMFFMAFYWSWNSSIKYSESTAGSSSTTTGQSVEPAMISREYISSRQTLAVEGSSLGDRASHLLKQRWWCSWRDVFACCWCLYCYCPCSLVLSLLNAILPKLLPATSG